MNSAKLAELAKKFKSLMDTYEPTFAKLKEHAPNAGEFDAAMWLRAIVDDRRDGLVQHGVYLRIACEEIAMALESLVNAFATVDTSNSASVDKFNNLAKSIVDDLSDANFTPHPGRTGLNFDTGDKGDDGSGNNSWTFNSDGTVTVKFDGDSRDIGEYLNVPGDTGNDSDDVDFTKWGEWGKGVTVGTTPPDGDRSIPPVP